MWKMKASRYEICHYCNGTIGSGSIYYLIDKDSKKAFSGHMKKDNCNVCCSRCFKKLSERK